MRLDIIHYGCMVLHKRYCIQLNSNVGTVICTRLLKQCPQNAQQPLQADSKQCLGTLEPMQPPKESKEVVFHYNKGTRGFSLLSNRFEVGTGYIPSPEANLPRSFGSLLIWRVSECWRYEMRPGDLKPWPCGHPTPQFSKHNCLVQRLSDLWRRLTKGS